MTFDPRAAIRGDPARVLGTGAAILGGIRVGKDAVVGVNALVVLDVDAADVVVWVPARSTRGAEPETSPEQRSELP